MFRFMVGAISILWCQTLYCSYLPAQDKSSPATAEDAAKVLDLTNFPKVNSKEEDNVNAQVLAMQNYIATGAVQEIGNAVRKALVGKGLKELEGSMWTNEYCTANFEAKGFRFTLSVTPSGQPNEAMVIIQNLGNVDLSKLPVPKSAKLMYSFPGVTAYTAEGKVDETKQECLKALQSQGWKPFGDTTVSFFVKKNAVRVQVMVSEAPAQAGKTMIQMSSEQMCVDFPVPPEIEWLQYAATPTSMQFRSLASQQALISVFKESLAEKGWKPTTDNPVKIDFHETLIFRNPAKEYMELEMQEVDGHWNCTARFQNAYQFAETEKRAKAQMEVIKKERAAMEERKKNPPKVQIPKLESAKIEDQSENSVEYTMKSGTAKTAVDKWADLLVKDGWKLEKVIDTKEVGKYSLKKDDVELGLDYVDPGFIPAQVSIDLQGSFKLELK